ncbi:MAG: hypothetical protein V7694_01725 [Rhodococcus sp. (in: high G+C Gram-positive bacteria)]
MPFGDTVAAAIADVGSIDPELSVRLGLSSRVGLCARLGNSGFRSGLHRCRFDTRSVVKEFCIDSSRSAERIETGSQPGFTAENKL